MIDRRNLLALGALAALVPPALGAAARNLIVKDNRLFLDVAVNGKSVRALLDSAAEASFIDTKFAPLLGLGAGKSVLARGSGGDTQAGLVEGVRVEALGLKLGPYTAGVLDLSGVSGLVGAPVSVILGRELFDAARFSIDIEGGHIAVAPGTRTPPGKPLALQTERGIETFAASVEGHAPVRAVFDLGNGSNVLVGAAYAKQLGLLTDGRPVTDATGGGIGGHIHRQSIMLASLEIAGTRFTNVVAEIDPTGSAANLNVSVKQFRRFQITTDFAQHTLWLAA